MTDQSMGVTVRERQDLFEGSYVVLGHPVRVRTADADVMSLIEQYLRPFADGVHPGRRTEYVIVPSEGELAVARDGEILPEVAGSPAGILDVLLWRLHIDAMDHVDRHVTIHASAAVWRGQGLVLPAPMDSGKSTTIAGLVRAGFDYLTDEAALIDMETAWLHPYHKPLTFDPPTLDVMPDLQALLPLELAWGTRLRYHIPAEDLRPGSLGGPAPVRFIVSPRYERGGHTELTPVSPAEAVVMLAENSFNFERLGPRALEALGRAADGAQAFHLRIGDLDSAVRMIRDLVDG